MSKEEKYYCARCGSDLTKKRFNCYASEIDSKLICLECFSKEQPKYLTKQIVDLEAKLAESESKIKVGEFWCSAYLSKQLDYDNIYAELRQSYDENEKLKQQLAGSERGNARLKSKLLQFYTRLGTNIHEQALVEFAKLKQQLADKDQAIEGLQEINKSLGQTCNNDAKEIERLREELAEKDKEVKELKTDLFVKNLDKEYDCILGLQNAEQDKISFAVEQLEKVKAKILSYEEIYYQCLENGAKIPVFCVENFRVRQKIDNQIKQLKEGK